MKFRVFAWADVATTGPPLQGEWSWTELARFSCTLCAAKGIAKGVVGASRRYCDTIVMDKGNAVSCEVLSPEDDSPGHIILDLKGAKYAGFDCDLNSSASGVNFLVAKL